MIAVLVGLAAVIGIVVSLVMMLVNLIRKRKQFKAVIVLVVCVIAFAGSLAFLIGSDGGAENASLDAPSDVSASAEVKSDESEMEQTADFKISGNTYSAEYVRCYESDLVSGCFYIVLDLKNTGDVEAVYLLDDVYVDNYHCTTGTGLPVTAAAGKSVKGSFIVFCEEPLDDVQIIEFKLKASNYETYQTIETSETITVYPNQ